MKILNTTTLFTEIDLSDEAEHYPYALLEGPPGIETLVPAALVGTTLDPAAPTKRRVFGYLYHDGDKGDSEVTVKLVLGRRNAGVASPRIYVSETKVVTLVYDGSQSVGFFDFGLLCYYPVMTSDGQLVSLQGAAQNTLDTLSIRILVVDEDMVDANNRVDVGTIVGNDPLDEDTIAAKILETPANLIATDDQGRVSAKGGGGTATIYG